MQNIAAGMESDTDSDCDMVFNMIPSNKSVNSNFKKPFEPEFVPVSKSAVDMKKFENGAIPNNIVNTNSHWNSKYRNSKVNHSTNQRLHNREKINSREKRAVVHKAMPLDDLRYAVLQGNLDVVKSILQKDIWVDCILKSGWTALMYACSAGHPHVVLYLLENKANPNYHRDQYTPLMAVCASSKDYEVNLLDCCRHLIRFGAQINAHERHLMTPLMFAAKEGHFEIVKELLNAGATLPNKDNRGQTALSWAALNGHGVIARYLASNGANLSDVDNSGQTPSDLARQNDHIEVADVLDRFMQSQTKITEPSSQDIEAEIASKSKAEVLKQIPNDFAPKPKEKYIAATQGDLELFLNGIGLSYLVSTFHDQHLGFTDLLVMNDDELEKVGIKQMGVRNKILDAAKAAHKKKWDNSSLHNLAESQYISCPDAVAMMANISKHLKLISTSVAYVRSQMESQPRILEISMDVANVHDLLDEMEDGLKNVRNLDDEMGFLKVYLNKIQGNSRFVPGDLVIDPVPTSKRTLQSTIAFSFVAITCTVLLWKKPDILSSIGKFLQSYYFQIPFLSKT